jgi:hypothetical protein
MPELRAIEQAKGFRRRSQPAISEGGKHGEQQSVPLVEIYVQDIARAKKFYETVMKAHIPATGESEAELWSFPMAQNGPGAPAHSSRCKACRPGATA